MLPGLDDEGTDMPLAAPGASLTGLTMDRSTL